MNRERWSWSNAKIEIERILRKYLNGEELRHLIDSIDSVYNSSIALLSKQTIFFPDEVPLQKQSDEFKSMMGLQKALDFIDKKLMVLAGKIETLPQLSKDKINHQIEHTNIAIRQKYKGFAYHVVRFDEFAEDEEYLNINIDSYLQLTKTMRSGINAALQNSRFAAEARRGCVSRECVLIREIGYLISSAGVDISYEGGSGTEFELIIREILGMGDASRIIARCSRNPKD